jgi:hypothetical protein
VLWHDMYVQGLRETVHAWPGRGVTEREKAVMGRHKASVVIKSRKQCSARVLRGGTALTVVSHAGLLIIWRICWVVMGRSRGGRGAGGVLGGSPLLSSHAPNTSHPWYEGRRMGPKLMGAIEETKMVLNYVVRIGGRWSSN